MTTGDVVYSLRFSLIKILPEPGFDLGSTAGESCVLTARLHMLYGSEHLTNPTTLPLHSYWLFIMISGEGLEGFHPYVEKNNNKIIIMYI